MASEVAAGSVPASALLNVFIGDLEEMGASVLNCEWPHTGLRGARVGGNTHEVQAAVQRDLARLKEGADLWRPYGVEQGQMQSPASGKEGSLGGTEWVGDSSAEEPLGGSGGQHSGREPAACPCGKGGQ